VAFISTGAKRDLPKIIDVALLRAAGWGSARNEGPLFAPPHLDNPRQVRVIRNAADPRPAAGKQSG
jgi:hypothetical protein